MKKLLCIAVIVAFCAAVNAQDKDIVITGTKKIDKKVTPQQVIDSLEKRFPNAKAVEYYKVPEGGVNKQGWNVTEEDNLSGESIDYYTLTFKNEGLKYYGLYKADGTLVKSKVEEKVANLPEAVKTSLKNIASQYPGYKVVSKTYYKDRNYEKSKEYYEIIAEKGTEKKKLFYSPDGSLIKSE